LHRNVNSRWSGANNRDSFICVTVRSSVVVTVKPWNFQPVRKVRDSCLTKNEKTNFKLLKYLPEMSITNKEDVERKSLGLCYLVNDGSIRLSVRESRLDRLDCNQPF
jgi:hypothetical protein